MNTWEGGVPACPTHTASRARQVLLTSVPRVPELEDGGTGSTSTRVFFGRDLRGKTNCLVLLLHHAGQLNAQTAVFTIFLVAAARGFCIRAYRRRRTW